MRLTEPSVDPASSRTCPAVTPRARPAAPALQSTHLGSGGERRGPEPPWPPGARPDWTQMLALEPGFEKTDTDCPQTSRRHWPRTISPGAADPLLQLTAPGGKFSLNYEHVLWRVGERGRCHPTRRCWHKTRGRGLRAGTPRGEGQLLGPSMPQCRAAQGTTWAADPGGREQGSSSLPSCRPGSQVQTVL